MGVLLGNSWSFRLTCQKVQKVQKVLFTALQLGLALRTPETTCKVTLNLECQLAASKYAQITSLQLSIQVQGQYAQLTCKRMSHQMCKLKQSNFGLKTQGNYNNNTRKVT